MDGITATYQAKGKPSMGGKLSLLDGTWGIFQDIFERRKRLPTESRVSR